MIFPENCLRGVRKKEWITDDYRVSPLAFEADSRTKNEREDGLMETSISWEDSTDVLLFCFENIEDVFIHGAVRLATKHIDYIKKHSDCGRFSYERRRRPDNEYHGNILFDPNLAPSTLSNLN
jgi:hypothetical protein